MQEKSIPVSFYYNKTKKQTNKKEIKGIFIFLICISDFKMQFQLSEATNIYLITWKRWFNCKANSVPKIQRKLPCLKCTQINSLQ